jgi:hypothetical protein
MLCKPRERACTNHARCPRPALLALRHWQRRFAGASFGILVLAHASAGFASDNLWLVTRVDVNAAKPDEVEASNQLPQLLRSRGLDVLDGPGASSEFERRHSRTPRELSAKESADLDTSLRKLADELASENLEHAQELQTEIDALSPDIRDQLNHETQRARRRFHNCLLTAHLFSKGGFQNEASEQIRKCARDFPGLEPEQSPYLPDSIRKFFGHAHEELERIRPSTVHVDLENYSVKDCRARVNGIDRGPTPATVDEVRTQRVRIQVDCGKRPGRIYDVALEPGDNSFRIDPDLDRAVQANPALGLSYPNTQTAANNRLLHSLRLARAVGATYVLQIYGGELHRIDVATRRDTIVGELTTPLEQLVDSVFTSPETAHPSESNVLATSASDSRPSTPYATVGWIAAGAAALAGVGVFIAWRVREDAVNKFNDNSRADPCAGPFANDPRDCPGFIKNADSAENTMRILGFTGIALAGVATTFFVLDATHGSSESRAARSCGPGPGELGVACRMAF